MNLTAGVDTIVKAYLPLVASALVLALATRPGSHALLGMVALIPLFSTIFSSAPRVAFRRGVVWGAALALFLLLRFGDSSPSLAACSPLPVVGGAYVWLGARLTRWIGFCPFVLGVGWVGVELVLFVSGFQLGLLAATQPDGWLMHSIGQALGYALVASLVASVNAALTAMLLRLADDRVPMTFRILALNAGRVLIRILLQPRTNAPNSFCARGPPRFASPISIAAPSFVVDRIISL